MKNTYVSLLTYTDQGIRAIKQSPQRALAARQQMEAAGIKVIAQLLVVESVVRCACVRTVLARGPRTLRCGTAADPRGSAASMRSCATLARGSRRKSVAQIDRSKQLRS